MHILTYILETAQPSLDLECRERKPGFHLSLPSCSLLPFMCLIVSYFLEHLLKTACVSFFFGGGGVLSLSVNAGAVFPGFFTHSWSWPPLTNS